MTTKTIAVISVHRKWWEKIKSGEKKWELRKQAARLNITEFWIYLVGTGTIVGKFDTGKSEDCMVWGPPLGVWTHTGQKSGMDKKTFIEYFKGKEIANAYKIDKLTIFKKPIPLTDIFPDGYAPQSYRYAEV